MAPVAASGYLLFRRTYLVILCGAALWCAALALAPLLAASGEEGGARVLYGFFHRICHQLDARSLHLAGEPLAVCARCTGIYAAFLLGTMLYPLVRGLHTAVLPPRGLLAAAVAPMLLDVLGGLLGLYEVSVPTRLLSGSIAGFVLPFFIIPAAGEAVREILAARTHTTPSTTTEGLSDA